jgi:drug/metabolite transporter (DMT)-like permease
VPTILTGVCYSVVMIRKFKAPLGASLVIVSSFFYASYGIWTKLMGDFFEGYTASALRSALVLIILIPGAIFYRQLQPVRIKQNWRYILGMFIAALFIWGPLYYAILHAGVGISLAVAYASIILGSFFFGWAFVGERFTKDKAISALLGIAGLVLIFSPATSGISLIALLGALGSGVASGASLVFSKQVRYNATQSTIVLWITSLLANSLMAFVFHESVPKVGMHVQYLYLIIFAFASVVATWSLVRGVKLIEAGAAGVLGLFEVVFGVVFGVVFFRERPGAIVLLGIATVIVAAAIPYFKDYDAKRGTLN